MDESILLVWQYNGQSPQISVVTNFCASIISY